MAAGKNKLARGIKFQMDDSGGNLRDLSADLVPGSLNGLGFEAGEINMTGENQANGVYLTDRKENTLSFKLHANNTATTGATTVVNSVACTNTSVTITIDVGDAGAAPATGGLRFTGEFVVLKGPLVNDGGRLVHDCVARPIDTSVAWSTTP